MPPVTKFQGMELLFRGLNLMVDKKEILKDVSGMAVPGDMLAVMGPSGSGKTTLLNALAGRLAIDSGSITLNEQKINKKLKRKICYVLQQDLLFGNLTCRETLVYTAMLRLPDSMKHKEKLKRVDEIVDTLDIRKCLDTIVGETFSRGMSGGERKRTNIGCELLTNPMLMLLDEPTSGLDSSTACSLIKTLKAYTKRSNKTVVTTIHQPSSQIFHMFDRVLLLTDGQVAYFGNAHKILDFFDGIGLHCTPHYNPADFILEKVKEDESVTERIIQAANDLRKTVAWPDELRKASCSRNASFAKLEEVEIANGIHLEPPDKKTQPNGDTGGYSLINSGVQVLSIKSKEPIVSVKINDLDDDDDSTDFDSRWPTSFWTQYKTLTMRTFKQSRPRILSKLQIIQAFLLAIITGLIWFQLPRTEETLNDRMGVIFFVTNYWTFMTALDAITSFPEERAVINKERASGAYRLSAYYFAKMTSEVPIMIILPTGSILITYWMSNLNGIGAFFLMWLTLLLGAFTSQSLGLFIGAACLDVKTAITAAAITMLAAMLAGGFYTRHLPFWFEWFRYLSFVHYSYHASLIFEFQYADDIECAPPNATTYPECLQPNTTHFASQRVLDVKEVDWPAWGFVLVLFAFIFVFRFLGYIVLRYFRKPHTV